MIVKLLNKHLEVQSLKEGCTGSSESTLVNMPHCWKSLVMAQILKFRVWEILNFYQGKYINKATTRVMIAGSAKIYLDQNCSHYARMVILSGCISCASITLVLIHFTMCYAKMCLYNKTCLKRPLKKKTKDWFSRPIIP